MRNPFGRRTAMCVLMLLLVAPLEVGFWRGSGDSELVCVRAGKWADDNQERLPTSLGELVAFPESYRSALIDRLPAHRRAELWREQVHLILAGQRISPEQRAILQRILPNLTESFYGRPKGQPVSANFMQMIVDLRGVTTNEQASLFHDLGVVATPDRRLASVGVSIKEWWRGRTVVQAQGDGGTCTCSLTWYCIFDVLCSCMLGNVCNPGHIGCTPINYSCGPFGGFTCDGNCEDWPQM